MFAHFISFLFFHLKQQRAAAYICLKRERIDERTKKNAQPQCITFWICKLRARSDTTAAGTDGGSRSQWFTRVCLYVLHVKLTG